MIKKRVSVLTIIFLFLLVSIPTLVWGDTASDVATRRAKLESDLAQVEKDISAQNALLQSKQKETASIERDLSILDYKITTAKLNIRAKQLEIQGLSGGGAMTVSSGRTALAAAGCGPGDCGGDNSGGAGEGLTAGAGC